jgi:17beta-estradiol 17-dehydrogenase / very-long-chain 3-oxoacyl-CoA reductase
VTVAQAAVAEVPVPVLLAVGGALAAVPVWWVLSTVLGALLFLVWPARDVRKYGQWAVVTGATAGIGLGFAQELARRKMSVVLISRTQDKLKEAEQAIKAKSPAAQVKLITLDFATADAAAYQAVADQLKTLNVGLLVNNVGVSYDHAAFLGEIDDALVDRLIAVNVTALTRMTRMLLPGMLERKRGAILNIGSAAGLIPCGDPLYAVYSGTKAYVDFFSRSLHMELRSTGVDVQCSVPYFVVSNMSRIRRPSLMAPTAITYARAALNKIGYGATVVPYWPHALQHFVITHAPRMLVDRMVWNHHADVRKRALRKKEKAQ